ncbi:hypothetical protein WBO78_04740 [Bosea sp. CCNWLW174]|uniref:hypothetical protein n=1 Tax=unclassified Bosea (in: a-proteobacteria) TaxID=2653178 RepID=UPI003014BEA6
MRVTDKITLVEKIGTELQSRFSFADVDAFLGGFSVPKPVDAPMNSKRLYAKTALAGVSDEIILRMAYELGLEIPGVPPHAASATPPRDAGKVANDSERLLKIRDLAREHFSEGDWHELGLLTGSDDIVTNHPRLLRSLSWDDADYPDTILPVLIGISKRDPGNIAIMESFARKRGQGEGENVSSGKSTGKTIVFQPKVFEVPNALVDPMLISVMMPFHSGMKPVYSAIEAAAKVAGFQCQKADDIWEHSAVIQDIFSLIYRSFIVVCDFTGRNANVFYEAGIAHTLGKHVVPISQSDGDIPFDLRHHRQLSYLNNGEGLQELQRKLAERFRTLHGQR